MVPVGSYFDNNPYNNIDMRCTICYNIKCKEEVMKGRSRKKKKTDWSAVRMQILVTVLSGTILKVIELSIEKIADKFF